MLLSNLDVGALLASFGMWLGYSLVAHMPRVNRHSLAYTTERLRVIWMRRMCDTEVRVADASLLGNLMRSVAFFASASILVMSGLVALIGSGERAFEVFQSLPFHDPNDTLGQFETKCVLLACVFVYAFFQVTWSLRQFNYTCIMVGAAPKPTASDREKDRFAQQAGRLAALAAQSFNMGLRAYYFALAMLTWFISPWFYVGASVLVVLITYRREFRSKSLECLRQAVDASL